MKIIISGPIRLILGIENKALIISTKDEKLGYSEALKIKKNLSQLANVDIMGPVGAPIYKIKNKFFFLFNPW